MTHRTVINPSIKTSICHPLLVTARESAMKNQSARSTHSQYAVDAGEFASAHSSRAASRLAFSPCTTRTISSTITTASKALTAVAQIFAVFVMAHSVQVVTA